MKNIILILLGVVVGAGIAFPVISQKSDARARALQEEINSLKGAAPTATNSTLSAFAETPVQILARLNKLDPVPRATRAKTVRQIVHDLQALTSQGQSALADIRRFLAEGKDVEYIFLDERAQPENFWAWHPGQPLKVGEFILPPSLRLGLIDVCRYIGGEDAEVTLAFLLNSSRRGVEVAGAGQILDVMNKGAYHELADGVAKRLLANPVQSHSPLDAMSTSILTAMLIAHGNTSLVPTAKENMVKPDGSLDVNAAQYLTGVKKEKSMADLYEVYQKPDTTADTRTKLASLSLHFVGMSTEADQMVGDLLKNEAVDSNTRAMNILMLGNAVPGISSTTPITPAVAAKRITFLQNLASTTKNEQINKAVAEALNALKAIR